MAVAPACSTPRESHRPAADSHFLCPARPPRQPPRSLSGGGHRHPPRPPEGHWRSNSTASAILSKRSVWRLAWTACPTRLRPGSGRCTSPSLWIVGDWGEGVCAIARTSLRVIDHPASSADSFSFAWCNAKADGAAPTLTRDCCSPPRVGLLTSRAFVRRTSAACAGRGHDHPPRKLLRRDHVIGMPCVQRVEVNCVGGCIREVSLPNIEGGVPVPDRRDRTPPGLGCDGSSCPGQVIMFCPTVRPSGTITGGGAGGWTGGSDGLGSVIEYVPDLGRKSPSRWLLSASETKYSR